MPSFVIVAVGILIVLGLIIRLRINAFIALTTAALVVSFLAPGESADKVNRVAAEFGNAAGKIGLVIGFAAVIGEAMMRSGAADRIVQAFVQLMGEQRAPWALMSSGFVLSVPVFFDTVFYLLVPLARSLHRKTGRNFLLYILAISAGGAITHTLVPPTPGPLAMAVTLKISVGLMIAVGILVAIPAAVSGMFFARIMDSRMKIESLGDEPTSPAMMEATAQQAVDMENTFEVPTPETEMNLWEALLPVVLPVILISGDTVVGTFMPESGDNWATALRPYTSLAGNPSLALLLSMTAALFTWVRLKSPDGKTFGDAVETALLSGGLVILITAAGGAFGAMLKVTNIANDIKALFDGSGAVGLVSLLLAFGMAALLKVAQGSSTTAMITVSAMMASMNLTAETLGFNPVYLATSIGAGSLIGSWMNDSGFWIVAKMSGLTETEALKTWTPLLLVLGTVSLLVTILLSFVMPLTTVS
ncbi:MAG: gluconate permease [Planctomycetaceae bacterium]|nr:gluconate permease [Planctomycetaceae bacterium]